MFKVIYLKYERGDNLWVKFFVEIGQDVKNTTLESTIQLIGRETSKRKGEAYKNVRMMATVGWNSFNLIPQPPDIPPKAT